MYTPILTDEERELVDKLTALPKDRFQKCFIVLERENWFIETDEESKRARQEALKDEEVFLGQGRIKAEHYAKMALATATLNLELAKKELMKIYENWNKLEKDAPIYWDNIKTENGWKKSLVGNVARDYNEAEVVYVFPDGERVKS